VIDGVCGVFCLIDNGKKHLNRKICTVGGDIRA